VSAGAAMALLVATALPLGAPGPAYAGADAVASAKPGAGKPQRCGPARAHRAKGRRRTCRRIRLGLRVAPRAFERLVDVGGGALPGTRGPAPVPGSPGAPGTPTAPPSLPDYVGVTATEWRLALSRPLVGAGLVTVELRNKGEDPHDLVVQPEGGGTPLYDFPETDPGGYPAAGIELAAGRYTLFCSLAGHAEAGMTATLRVEPQP
jgi:hypothetical protein